MELVQFYKFLDSNGIFVFLFDYKSKRYMIYDNKLDIVVPMSADRPINKYDISIAKFILRLYGKDV